MMRLRKSHIDLSIDSDCQIEFVNGFLKKMLNLTISQNQNNEKLYNDQSAF